MRYRDPVQFHPHLVRASAPPASLEAITRGLKGDGVRAFCDSYRELLSRIDSLLQRVTASR